MNPATLAYTLPFALFIALLALNQVVPVPVWVRFVLPVAAIVTVLAMSFFRTNSESRC